MKAQLCGACRTAAMVDAGEVQSSLTGAEWHAKCGIAAMTPGDTPSKKGQPRIPELLRCSCSCVDDDPRCRICKTNDVELDPELHQCADEIACHGRVEAKLEASPRHHQYRQIQLEAAAARREARTDEDGEPVRRQRERKVDPMGGRCNHCGEPTKGGRFVAGHDAKLKGDLKRAAIAGEVDALVEILARGWLPKGKSTSQYDAVMEQALVAHEAEPSDATIARRTEARWAESKATT